LSDSCSSCVLWWCTLRDFSRSALFKYFNVKLLSINWREILANEVTADRPQGNVAQMNNYYHDIIEENFLLPANNLSQPIKALDRNVNYFAIIVAVLFKNEYIETRYIISRDTRLILNRTIIFLLFIVVHKNGIL